VQFFYIIIYIIKPSRCALIFFLVCHSPTSTAAQSHLKIFRHATPHLCNSLPPSLSEFVILISQLHHTALHHHPLIHDYLLRCLMASSILVSKLTFSPSLYSSRSSSLSRTDSTEYWHPVFGSFQRLKHWRVRQNQPVLQLASMSAAHCKIISLTYLFIYLLMDQRKRQALQSTRSKINDCVCVLVGVYVWHIQRMK